MTSLSYLIDFHFQMFVYSSNSINVKILTNAKHFTIAKHLGGTIFSMLLNAEHMESMKMMADLTDLFVSGRVGRSTRIILRTKNSNGS